MIKVSPSILAADQLFMHSEIKKMADAGCDLLHVDVMDAHFVPNLSYSSTLCVAISKAFPDLKLDIHLMMDEPEKYIHKYAAAHPEYLTIHAEIPGDVEALLKDIASRGIKPMLALKPATTVESIRHLLPLCAGVLVMTVEPGFGGQSLMLDQLDKIRELRAIGYEGAIESDGGITMENLHLLADAGLDIAVMGSAMYKSADPAADILKAHAM